MNTSMASPLIGLLCAASIGRPAGRRHHGRLPESRAGGRGGCVLHRHGRVPARSPVPGEDRGGCGRPGGTGGLPRRAVRDPQHRHLPRRGALWTIGAGLLVEVSPQAALIGVASATSLVFSASFDVSAVAGARSSARSRWPAGSPRPPSPCWRRRGSPGTPLGGAARSAAIADAVRRDGAGVGPAGGRHGHAGGPGPLGGFLAHRCASPWPPGRHRALPRDATRPTGSGSPRRRCSSCGPTRSSPGVGAVLRIIGSVAGAALTTLLLLALPSRSDAPRRSRRGRQRHRLLGATGELRPLHHVRHVHLRAAHRVRRAARPHGRSPNRVVDNLIGSAIAVAALWLWPNRPGRPVAPDHGT